MPEEIKTIDGQVISLEQILASIKDIKLTSELDPFATRSLIYFLDEKGIIPEEEQMKALVERAIVNNFMPADGGHNCYWNNGFYAAQRFNASEVIKKRTAIVALWNGRHRYFEWNTHGGFDNTRPMVSLGVITLKEAEIFRKEQGYVSMTKDVHDKLVDKIGLSRRELLSAGWLCSCIKEKERTKNWGSGQYEGLPEDIRI